MKKKTILWLAVAVVAVMAAAAAVFLSVVGGNARPALYRNLDGHLYGKNTTPRTPEADGTYQLRFAFLETQPGPPAAWLPIPSAPSLPK